MTINSRQKGAAGEREAAELFRFHGYTARRGQQFSGGGDSPDVVCKELHDNFHFEIKRVEQGNLYTWMAQAAKDADGKIPVVIHRRSRQDWVAILPAGIFLQLLHRAGYKPDDTSPHD